MSTPLSKELSKMSINSGNISEGDIAVHPLLKKLITDCNKLPDATILKGYIGPSTSEGYILLYPSLEDLSESIEIARAAILHSATAPESILPNGGTIIWVSKNADITYRRVGTAKPSEQLCRHDIGRSDIRTSVSTERTNAQLLGLYYSLGATSFSNYVWIRSQYFFKNPTSLALDLQMPSSFDIEAMQMLGGGPGGPFSTYVFPARNAWGGGGWVSFEFANLNRSFPSGYFKFRLVNRSSSTIKINGGSLEYGA